MRGTNRSVRGTLVLAVLMLGALLAACSSRPADAPSSGGQDGVSAEILLAAIRQPTPTPQPQPAASGPGVGLQVGQRAPAFTVATLDGKSLTSAALLAQEKPFILYFFATW